MATIFFGAALASLLAMTLLLPLLRAAGVVDIPNNRSSHAVPTPRGGGIAVALGIVVGCGFALREGRPSNVWVLGGLFAFATLGMTDDVRHLPVHARLAIQAVVAAGVSTMLISDGPAASTWVAGAAILVGAGWLVAYTNAFNFMDGVNGISGATASLGGAWYLYLGVHHHLDGVAVLGAAISGGAVGFLPWNIPRAHVFLGDVGSYALGFGIASVALWAIVAGVSPLAVAAPLLIYVADTGYTLARRILGGRPWHEAHREHVYQRLADLGLGHLGSTAACAGGSALICAWAYVSEQSGIAHRWWALGMAIVVVGYLLLPNLVMTVNGATSRLDRLAESNMRGNA